MLFRIRHRRARAAIDAELRARSTRRVALSGSVPSLTIRFLVDYFPAAQKVIAASQPPWSLLREADLRRIALALRDEGVLRIAPSAHDSCDLALAVLREIFGDGYHEVRAGGELTISAPAAPASEEASAWAKGPIAAAALTERNATDKPTA